MACEGKGSMLQVKAACSQSLLGQHGYLGNVSQHAAMRGERCAGIT